MKDNSPAVKGAVKQACDKWLIASGELVKSQAIANCPSDTGQLRNSIDKQVDFDNLETLVGTPLKHGLYVEKGTGEFAENGKGRKGYWVYVEGVENNPPSKKQYTQKQAKQVMAILRSKGLKAFYTNGRRPQPFLKPAFKSCKRTVQELLTQYLNEYLKG